MKKLTNQNKEKQMDTDGLCKYFGQDLECAGNFYCYIFNSCKGMIYLRKSPISYKI